MCISLDVHICIYIYTYYTYIGHINTSYKYIHTLHKSIHSIWRYNPIYTLINYIPFLPVSLKQEFSPQVPDSELLPTSPEPKENHGNAGGCFGCLFRCFFRGWPNIETYCKYEVSCGYKPYSSMSLFHFKKNPWKFFILLLNLLHQNCTRPITDGFFARDFWNTRRTSPSSCHVMLGFRAPTFLCQKVNKKPGKKKSRRGRSSGIYGTQPPGHPCHWDPPIFSKRWGNPLTESASISNSCNICGHLEIAKVVAKLLWLSHWMFHQGLGLPLPHDETMRLFRHGKKLGMLVFQAYLGIY